MSNNRASQLIQQLRDALELGDDDLAAQIRSDLFKEFGIEMADGGRVEMGLGGLIGKAFREGIEAAKKFPELFKVKGKSGGDLSIGDVLPLKKDRAYKFSSYDRGLTNEMGFNPKASGGREARFKKLLPKKIEEGPVFSNEDLVDLVKRLGGFQSGGRVGLQSGGISDLVFDALGDDGLGGSATGAGTKLMLLDLLAGEPGTNMIFNALGPLIGFRDGGNVGIMNALR